MTYKIAAFYHFATLDDYKDMQPKLQQFCNDRQMVGTILLGHEGINSTLAGSVAAVDELIAFLRSDPRLAELEAKYAYTEDKPFYRMKVRLKKEIVTLGVGEEGNPNRAVGEYVAPEDWNDLISDPDVVLVDTRNDYEVDIGTFKNALNPHTETFREFPEYVDKELADYKDKKVAMYCTGGIRCEKATALLLSRGFKHVYHLKGGILNYLEKIPASDSMWEGECFVFDNRVAVDHDLAPGQYSQCFGCRHPLTDEEMLSEQYVKGICCPHCSDILSDEKRASLTERQKQIELAKNRGEVHIGS